MRELISLTLISALMAFMCRYVSNSRMVAFWVGGAIGGVCAMGVKLWLL